MYFQLYCNYATLANPWQFGSDTRWRKLYCDYYIYKKFKDTMNCNLPASKYGLDPASAETSFAVTVSSWPSSHRQVRGYFSSPRMLSYVGTRHDSQED